MGPIPAGAGSSPPRPPPTPTDWDHSRRCGEQRSRPVPRCTAPGPSPRVRGAGLAVPLAKTPGVHREQLDQPHPGLAFGPGLDCTNGPVAGRHEDKGLLRQPSAVGILDAQVGSGLRGIHEHRRAVRPPRTALLPLDSRIDEDGLCRGKQFGLGVGGRPAHEQPVLWQVATASGLVRQDQRLPTALAHRNHAGRIAHLAGTVVAVGDVPVTDDHPSFRAAAPPRQCRNGDDHEGAAHRLDPDKRRTVGTRRVR